MNLREYQRQVANGIITKPNVELLSHAALGLCGESGEVADAIKKSQYLDRKLGPEEQEHVIEELGDTLWYLTWLTDRFGLTIEQLAERNHAKLMQRYPMNYTPLEGDS